MVIWSYPQAVLRHTQTHTLHTFGLRRLGDRNRPSERKDERKFQVPNRLAVIERRWGWAIWVYVWVCVYIPVCICTYKTALSCHCQRLMELPVGQHFIISVALSIAKPSLTCMCLYVSEQTGKCTRVSVCGPSVAITVICCHMST